MPRGAGAFRPAHVGHRESGHRAATRPFMERLPWVDVTYCKYGTTGSRPDCGPTTCAGDRAGLCRSGSRCASEDKGGLDSRGVSARGSGGSRASCFTAFLRRCARRLRAVTAELADRLPAEARGISYMSYFFRVAELYAELHEGNSEKNRHARL